MKKNILIKIGERYESRNVEMTPEEIAEYERQRAEMPEPEPSPDERLDAQVLYTALMTDTLLEVNYV